jgi:dTDP-4-amino-4,6-dideoxygalactose transaminase
LKNIIGSSYKIPYLGLVRQYSNIKEELLNATHSALKDGILVGGHYTSTFESWLAQKTKTQYALTVHSSSQALEIIARFRAYQYDKIRPNARKKEVALLPNIANPAVLNAFINAGWTIELCDTDNRGIIDYNCAVGNNEYIVSLVGLYGLKPHYDKEVFNYTHVIIDGSHHWLVAEGDVGLGMAISFDPTKNLPSSGNGGAIVTNNKALYDYARLYRDNAKGSNEFVATNSKMSEQDCAQLLVRTNYIDKWQARRKLIKEFYLERFRNLPIKCLSNVKGPHADQKFVIYCENRDKLKNYLKNKGIEAKIHYKNTLGELPITQGIIKPDLMSMSIMLLQGVLSLPIYPELTDSEVEYITECIITFTTK